MSEWYNDPVTPEEPQETPAAPETLTSDETAPVSSESPSAVEETQAPVSPAQETATPYAPPTPTPSPTYSAPYGAPQRPPYTPPYTYGQPRPGYGTPPAPVPPKRTGGATAAIAVLAVLCCVSLLISGILAVMLVTRDDAGGSSSGASNQVVDKNNDRVGNDSGPTLEISDIDETSDGGLTTREIVRKNLDATVVLTMYTESLYGGYYGFEIGTESGLTQAGAASGIIMSEDGYIITNSHCVYDEENGEEYDRIDVTLYDGRVYEGAEIIGYDPTTDLAVIKIEETGLTAAEFGDSSALQLGDRVITLGNSGGLQWSVSQGILSGQARDVYEDTGYAIKCLQVDAIINPGSSGGPLINAYGQVVGVNSAKIVLTGYEGLGFSIPINEAKEVIDDLIKYGYVTGRVSLGIMGRTITSIGYEGFMIDSINKDSALVGTKAQAGDIITHVNGVRVTNYEEMRTELTSYEVGDTVTLTMLRLDRQSRNVIDFDVTVTLAESQ